MALAKSSRSIAFSADCLSVAGFWACVKTSTVIISAPKIISLRITSYIISRDWDQKPQGFGLFHVKKFLLELHLRLDGHKTKTDTSFVEWQSHHHIRSQVQRVFCELPQWLKWPPG